MAVEKTIKSPADIPEGERYVLVMYGPEKKDTRHSQGVTISIAAPGNVADRNLKIVELRTAVDSAKRLADKEGISTVYVVDHA